MARLAKTLTALAALLLAAAPAMAQDKPSPLKNKADRRLSVFAGEVDGRFDTEGGAVGFMLAFPVKDSRKSGSLRLEAGAAATRSGLIDRLLSEEVLKLGSLTTDRGVLEQIVYARQTRERNAGGGVVEFTGLAYQSPRLGPFSLEGSLRGGVAVRDRVFRTVAVEKTTIGSRKGEASEETLSSTGSGWERTPYIGARGAAHLHLGRHFSLDTELNRPVKSTVGGPQLRFGGSVEF